jgi:hypothetical protein
MPASSRSRRSATSTATAIPTRVRQLRRHVPDAHERRRKVRDARRPGQSTERRTTSGGFSTPALGDLDADGDFDVLTGFAAPQINYFENTGTSAAPAYVLRTGAANPLNGRDRCGRLHGSVFGDLDGDGDLE